MKNHIITIFVCLLLGTSVGHSQKYLKLFKDQSFDKIAAVLSQDVKVKINRNKKTTGKEAGIVNLESFLKEFKPVRIESAHKGSEIRGDNNYIVGKLYNAKNEGIRFFINLENGQDGKVICDLKIRSL